MAEEERDADIAGEERVTAATVLRPLPFDLPDHVHRERACTLEPELIAGATVENEERVRVACGAVTEAITLGERPGTPGQLAARERELLVHDVAERRDNTCGAVAPLDADPVGPRVVVGWPVGQAVLAEREPREHVVHLHRPTVRKGPRVPREAVRRT